MSLFNFSINVSETVFPLFPKYSASVDEVHLLFSSRVSPGDLADSVPSLSLGYLFLLSRLLYHTLLLCHGVYLAELNLPPCLSPPINLILCMIFPP